MLRLSLVTATFGALLACSGGSDPVDTDAAAEDCSECSTNQLCVANIGGDVDRYECRDLPRECGTRPSCDDEDCLEEMYASCANGFTAVGCSDTTAPPIVSCNP